MRPVGSLRYVRALAACVLATGIACGPGPYPVYDPPRPQTPWDVPPGWKHELIPFPLDFAPSLQHAGVEELRFAPGFFDPTAPGYWSYAFVWRLEGYPPFDAAHVADELTTYFRGLVAAVDEKNEIADRESIVVHAVPERRHLALTAHVIDPFKTKKPVDLVGTAKQIACPKGAVWIFAFAPAGSPLRKDVDALAATATCGQPTVPNKPKPPTQSDAATKTSESSR
jgi:hypothetical protein